MGSQPRRTRDRRRGDRGRSGTGEGGDAESEEERRQNEEARERKRVYRKATQRVARALKEKNFARAAEIATFATVSQVSVQDAANLFLAGAKAFREGKVQEWKPKPTDLANNGIRYAQEKTGYELTPERRRFFSDILTTNLRKVAEKHGRK